MSLYDYECKNCKYELEIWQSMKDDALTVCPECKEPAFRRVITCLPMLQVKSYNTIGSLADKNWKKMGTYGKEERLRKDKIPELLEKRDRKAHMNKLAKMTPEQQKKWIVEGD